MEDFMTKQSKRQRPIKATTTSSPDVFTLQADCPRCGAKKGSSFKRAADFRSAGPHCPQCGTPTENLASLQDAQQDKAAPAEPYIVVEKTGARVALGSTITDFRGDQAVLVNFIAPHQAGSTGRVVVQAEGREELYYPSVYGLKIVVPEVK
jgi:rRNA maturation protein Nop10